MPNRKQGRSTRATVDAAPIWGFSPVRLRNDEAIVQLDDPGEHLPGVTLMHLRFTLAEGHPVLTGVRVEADHQISVKMLRDDLKWKELISVAAESAGWLARWEPPAEESWRWDGRIDWRGLELLAKAYAYAKRRAPTRPVWWLMNQPPEDGGLPAQFRDAKGHPPSEATLRRWLRRVREREETTRAATARGSTRTASRGSTSRGRVR